MTLKLIFEIVFLCIKASRFCMIYVHVISAFLNIKVAADNYKTQKNNVKWIPKINCAFILDITKSNVGYALALQSLDLIRK